MLGRGIKRKLVLSLVVTTMLLMGVFFILLDRYLKDYSISESDKTVMLLGMNTAPLLQKPLFGQDYNQLKSVVQPIILDDFDYVVIFDNMTRNVAFTNDNEGVVEQFDWQQMLQGKTTFGRIDVTLKGNKFTEYLFPIAATGVTKPLGFLVIGISESKMQSKLLGITYRIGVISVLMFLAVTSMIYYLSGKIVRPLKVLTRKIGAFASGDYSVRSDIKTSDETGILSDSFNFMADKINEQIVSIEEYSKNLEKMVEERTVELLQALDAIKEKDRKLNQGEKIRSLNSIVSSIAHEVNNPLAIISGNLQLIHARMEGETDEKLMKKISVAQLGVERIATLIDEINFFTSIKDVATGSIYFSGFLKDVVKKVVPEEVLIDISGVEAGSEDDLVNSNAHLLTVSLESVLTNSVEIARQRDIRGKIKVRYYKESPHFVVEIVDNAGGIKEPARVFDPFYTTFYEKKGLGLTFVYHAIQALDGEVIVENVENDETGEAGAKVTLMLPVEVEPEGEEEAVPWLP
ncbi:MAG: HAMP domain-containing protein [bacterium]|nr:HAMP domain-containing protein [bacterium]